MSVSITTDKVFYDNGYAVRDQYILQRQAGSAADPDLAPTTSAAASEPMPALSDSDSDSDSDSEPQSEQQYVITRQALEVLDEAVETDAEAIGYDELDQDDPAIADIPQDAAAAEREEVAAAVEREEIAAAASEEVEEVEEEVDEQEEEEEAESESDAYAMSERQAILYRYHV